MNGGCSDVYQGCCQPPYANAHMSHGAMSHPNSPMSHPNSSLSHPNSPMPHSNSPMPHPNSPMPHPNGSMPHAMMQPQDVVRPHMYMNAPQSVMGPGGMMRGPFMPPHGMCRMPLGPRMAMRPVWPPAEEDPCSGGIKRKRGGGGSRGRKKVKAGPVDEYPSNSTPSPATTAPPSFLEDPNAYLAQQTAMLNNTMAGGLGQFSPQGNAAPQVTQPRPPSQATPVNSSAASIVNGQQQATYQPAGVPGNITGKNIINVSATDTSIVPLPSTVLIPARVSKASNVNSSNSAAAMAQATIQSIANSNSNGSTAKELRSEVTSAPNTSQTSQLNNLQIDALEIIPKTTLSSSCSSISATLRSITPPSQMITPAQACTSELTLVQANPPLITTDSHQNNHINSVSCASSVGGLNNISHNKSINHSRPRCSSPSVSFTNTVTSSSSTEPSSTSVTSSHKLTTSVATSPSDPSVLSSSFQQGNSSPINSFNSPLLNAANNRTHTDNKTPKSGVNYSRALVSPQSRGTEMLAIRSKVLRASPTSNFDMEKEEHCDGDDADDGTVSNDNSEVDEDNCSTNSFDVSPVCKVASVNRSNNKNRQINSNFVGRHSAGRKSLESLSTNSTGKLISPVSGVAVHRSQSSNDACNKPLSPGPISSSCTQTPLEMVQNIVSSIPLPPASPTLAPIPTSRNTPTFLAQSHQATTVALPQQLSALQPTLYDGMMRGGILVQQQAVANTNNNVVVMGNKTSGGTTTHLTLPPVQPVVHLVNPFSSSTPVIIQQAGGLGNIGICSTAQLMPTSAATFVAQTMQQQHQHRNISHGLMCHKSNASGLPHTSSPHLQVTQIMTTDMAAAVASARLSGMPELSPTGSSSSSTPSTVSTPHATPPESTPSPQPASKKKKRRRNNSGCKGVNNINDNPGCVQHQQPNILPATAAILMNSRQQQMVMAPHHQPQQHHHHFSSVANGAHLTTQVMTNSGNGAGGSATAGNIMTVQPPATTINVVQMVNANMAGGLTAGHLQVQPPTILVGSSAPPGVLLPPDATFLSTDPNTGLPAGLTYPLQIVGVTSQAQHMLAVRPPHTSAGKVVTNCLSSPTVCTEATPLQLYSPHHSTQATLSRHLCPPTAVIAPDYLTYQQHVFMQQQQLHDKAHDPFLTQHTTFIATGPVCSNSAITSSSCNNTTTPATSSLTASSSLVDSSGHSVSISTQTFQSEGDNCDVSSTGDIQQCRVPSSHCVSPNSPSHQSAEVTTTRLDEEPCGTPHKVQLDQPSPNSGHSSPAAGERALMKHS